jgi:hypothetical protein
MRGGLVDDAGQCAKLLGAGGYSCVVQGICHLGFSFGWDFMGETIGEARSSCQQVLSLPNTPCDYSESIRPVACFAFFLGLAAPNFLLETEAIAAARAAAFSVAHVRLQAEL